MVVAYAKDPKKDKEDEDKIPAKTLKSIPDLTNHLTAELSSEREKVRALYTWITENIEYDYEATQKGKVTFFKGPENVLKDKKAVCTGYVFLFGAMLDEIGIEWEEVVGYTNSFNPYFIPSIILDDHAWIAVKVDGEWQMADPTWDAGYIGPLFKESKVDPLEKQEKRIKAIEKKNRKLKAKGRVELKVPEIDTIPEKNYNGKIGFVPDPGYEWFLVPSDSFITRHLPVNPMWQLRSDTLGIYDFVQGPKRVKQVIGDEYREYNYDYKEVISYFETLDYLQKQLFLGDDAIDFFANNYRARAKKYFRFQQVMHIKEMREYLKEALPERESRGMHAMLKDIADSTQAYGKIVDRYESNRHKEMESFYKESFKSTAKCNSSYEDYLSDIKEWHKDAEEDFEDDIDRLLKEASKIELEKRKLKQKNPALAASVDSLEYEFANVSNNGKAMIEAGKEFDMQLKAWKEKLEHPAIISIQYRNRYNQYLLERRKLFIEQKFTEYNRYIDSLDAQLDFNITRIEQLYDDSVKAELLPSELYKYCKQMVVYFKSYQDDLRTASNNAEPNAEQMQLQAANFVYAHLKEAEDAITQARDYLYWIDENLDTVTKEWKQMEKLLKQQLKLNKEKEKFLSEMEETTHKREKDLVKVFEDYTTKWKRSLN